MEMVLSSNSIHFNGNILIFFLFAKHLFWTIVLVSTVKQYAVGIVALSCNCFEERIVPFQHIMKINAL